MSRAAAYALAGWVIKYRQVTDPTGGTGVKRKRREYEGYAMLLLICFGV